MIFFLCLMAIGFAILSGVLYLRTTWILKKLDQMIAMAIDGDFVETEYNETMLSRLETRMYQYLSLNRQNQREIAKERDRVQMLISDISHQTKTPVSNILLYSELLSEQDLSPVSREYISSLSAQAEKLNFLITSLVKLSRLETGILTLSPKKTSVFPMLENLIKQYTPSASEKGLFLSISDTEDNRNDPAAVFDEKWTTEAIGNLIDNAIKYTECGSITLSVKSYEMFLCIQITDTGIGISEQEQPKIFSRFYRAESVHEKPGVGIGLFLARQIIMMENGYMKVSSKPGRGSVFSLYLPL